MARDVLFSPELWAPALEKYAGVTRLTVALYDVEARIVCGPINPTPLFRLFAEHGYDPGILLECARRCLVQTTDRPAVVVMPSHGLAVVGSSLVLRGEVVGAAVGGYVLADFSQPAAVRGLAREAGIPFMRLWEVARREQPVPARRLRQNGELLQVLGDALLSENYRTRQHEDEAARLTEADAAKDEFLAVLSHELRTPLTPILGWARVLRAGGDAAKVQRGAETIERNALLQVKLVEDLLDLNRLTRGKMALETAVHDLNDVLPMAVDAVTEPAAQKGVEVRVDHTPEPLPVSGDAGRLQQIFRNILSNALKFTPPGGLIRVRLGRERDAAIVSLTDTGEGIAPDFLPFIYDIFQQQETGTRRLHGGLGIGLAVVKRLTELHGGSIRVTSEGLGCGTQVVVRLPVVDGVRPVTASPPGALSVAAANLDGVRILIVEDVDDAREATRVLLETYGAVVDVAQDGVEGLDAARRGRFDVILCDLRMPRMDGFEFLRELDARSGEGHPPVIAISGLASDADHRRTSAAGFVAHVDKPFLDVTMLAAIGVAIEERQSRH